MDDLFESAWLKWAQAVSNAEVLERNLNELTQQGVLQMPFGMTQEYDAKRHCVIVTAGPDDIPTIFPPVLGLLLGDVVHNYRSSLDHLAWALYKRGHTPNLPARQEQGVYFPIATSRDQFNGWLRGKRPKLPGVRRADVAIVRRYQPYVYGKRRLDQHVLLVLDELSNADKHRVIQPVQAVPESSTWHITNVRDCVITRVVPRARRIVLEPGAELVRLYVRKLGPDPYVEMEPSFTIDPTVYGRFALQQWAVTTMRIVANILLEFAEPSASVRALLGATRHGASPPWLPLP